ncbi:MAG: ABC transporter permease [Cellulosilyticaceae bacterium]
MKTSDLIMMSIRSLWRRKLRTCLTILGVVIGASSIILMLSLGIAMDANFREQMSQMSSLTLIDVYSNSYGDPNAPKLDDKAIETLSKIPNVEMVIPNLRTNVYLEFGKYRTSWQVEVRGMSVEEMAIMGYKVDEGREMAQGDLKVIFVGEEIRRQFTKQGKEIDWRNPPEPLALEVGKDKLKVNVAELDYRTGKPIQSQDGKSVKPPKPWQVTVEGLFGPENYETMYTAIVPKALYEEIVDAQDKYRKQLYGKDYNKEQEKYDKYRDLKVKVASEKEVQTVQQAIRDAGFEAYSPMEYIEEMKKVSNSIQIILGGIGAISLFVAAIGITNTMMMSIYERTREIGIMKVIGARITDIKKMFLVEALMIGAIGGLIGVIFSYLISFLINKFGPQIAGELASMMGGGSYISLIPLWLSAAALVFSTCIGLVSGYFPARRAMKLSALSAIKTE